MLHRSSFSTAGFALFLLLPVASTRAETPVVFREVSGPAEIQFVHDSRGHVSGGTEQQDLWGSGVAWVDLNHDHWPDLVLANGAEGNRIYLNDGDGTFTEVSASLGLLPSRVANGIAAADVDNDGFEDLAFGNFRDECQFYLGGDGSLVETSAAWGLAPMFGDPGSGGTPVPPESMGVAFGDYDQDGFLDLYVANHLDQRDVLYRNLAGSTFQRTGAVDVTARGYGFGGVFWDFDNDGDQDIYVANDFGSNFLLENQGRSYDFAFIDMAQVYKIAGGADSTEPKSMGMGIAIGDYDNDLDLDLYITNYFLNALYENLGRTQTGTWRFRERAAEAGVEYPLNCWGVDFCDLDLDGDLDLIQASGYIPATMEPMEQPMDLPDKVWINEGGPAWTFRDVSEEAGFSERLIGRGLATADYDLDGDVDVAVTNNTYYEPNLQDPSPVVHPGPFRLYRNDQSTGNHWVVLELEGAGAHSPGLGCNRSAVGARAYVTAGGQTQMAEVRAGESYLSQNSLALEFGIGSATSIEEVRIRWVCGAEEVFTGVVPDGVYHLVEGAGTGQIVPVAIAEFGAHPVDGGVLLEWTTAVGLRVLDAQILRTDIGAGDERVLDLQPVLERNAGSAFDADVRPGRSYRYRVALLGTDGVTILSAPVELRVPEGVVRARAPRLGQNFPNPFNPSTVIEFEVRTSGPVVLRILDPRGRQIRRLYDGSLPVGTHRVDWDGTDDAGHAVASGDYIYVLQTPAGSSSRRMVLVR